MELHPELQSVVNKAVGNAEFASATGERRSHSYTDAPSAERRRGSTAAGEKEGCWAALARLRRRRERRPRRRHSVIAVRLFGSRSSTALRVSTCLDYTPQILKHKLLCCYEGVLRV
ncbi:nuclear nucleic acid-binding protein C1D isoform X2 [Nannospalax galili]|uniref:nuclear nucleic acid-binding protein C1D isoform X2 n=1 Tax=Nannospalax galili TaxID=1026970 RepID=UPI00111C7D94|nr:nuclear nucleic acid-binding protein C1D isoform X2 [Nannospalax galili]